MIAARSWVLLALVGCAAKTAPPPAAPQQPAPLYVLPAADPNAPAAQPVPAPPPPETRIAAGPPPVINSVFAGDLPLLPVDSELVFGVNAARLQQSALWATLLPRFASKLDWLPLFTKTCGFDPIASLTTVTLGMKGLKSGNAEGAIVAHGVPTAKLAACVPKIQKLGAKSDTKVTTDGDTFTFADKTGHKVTFGFTDPTTLVVVVGPHADKAALAAVKAGTSALSTSPAFMEMLAQISPTDAVVMLMNGTAVGTMPLGIDTKAIFGSLDLTDSLTIDVRMRMKTADAATQLATLAQSQISNPQTKQFFQRLDIVADGVDVKFGVTMNSASLETLLGMLVH